MSVNYFHNFPKLARDSGFSLKENENDGFIDWRFIASIDTNRIIKDSDFEKLEECLPHLVNSALGSVLNTRILDPAIGKFYTISQLSIQYLLFCKQFLDKTVNDLRDNIFQNQRNVFKLEKMLQKREDELANFQKKAQRTENVQHIVYPCTKCTKYFISLDLLNVHMSRKHQAPIPNEVVDKDSNLIQTIKMELEIKQLKERLNVAEKELVDQKQSITECGRCKEDKSPQKKVHEIGIQSNFVEIKEIDVKDSHENDLKEILSLQQQQFQDWKKEEKKKYNAEMNGLRNKLDETIELLKKKESEQKISVPVVQRVVDKCLDTSSLIDTRNQRNIEEENLWKIRCKEMEQMYQDNQKKTSQTLENLEKMYNDKIMEFENSLKKTTSLSSISETRPMFPENNSSEASESEEVEDQKSSNLQIFIESPETEEDEREFLTPVKRFEVPVIVEPKPRTKVDVKKVSLPQKHFPVKKQKKSQKRERTPEQKEEKKLGKIKEFAPEKGKLKKIKSKLPESPPEKIIKKVQETSPEFSKSPKLDAVKLFKSRLKAFGIDHKEELLTKSKFNTINEDLARNREEAKKKYKSFFITRKSLNQKVDEILQDRSQNSLKSEKSAKKTKLSLPDLEVAYKRENSALKIKDKENSSAQREPSKKMKGSSQKVKEKESPVQKVKEKEMSPSQRIKERENSAQKSREKEKSPPKMQGEETKQFLVNVDVETKYPIIKEVEPEQDKPPKNFRENLEKMLQKQIQESTLTLNPKLDDIEEIKEAKIEPQKSIAPKPAIKKKVLFNLDTIEENSSKNGSNPPKPTVQETNSDSDWNISSFEEDEIVLKS